MLLEEEEIGVNKNKKKKPFGKICKEAIMHAGSR